MSGEGSRDSLANVLKPSRIDCFAVLARPLARFPHGFLTRRLAVLLLQAVPRETDP